jgi:hypothetical protein
VAAEKQAVSPYTSPAMTPAFQATVALNEATTYPLPTPTEDDWCVATNADHNLARLATVLTAKGTLTKAELTEKA